MIHPGERLENPDTGEAMVVHRTSAQSDGEEVFVEVTVRPHGFGFVAAAPLHPYQTKRFEVLEGRLDLRVGDEQLVAIPGDIAVVTPGTVHGFSNAGDEDVRFTVEVRPALQLVADRDDVHARCRGQDEPQGHAKPASARRDRSGALRHCPPSVSTAGTAASTTRARCSPRQGAGLPGDGDAGTGGGYRPTSLAPDR